MNIAIALSALVIVTALFVFTSRRASKAVRDAKSDRDSIYRSCFLRGLSGILAKMASADGSVAADESAVAMRLFREMELSKEDLALCEEAYRVAQATDLGMGYYASLFAPYSTRESRILVYEILWDVVAADGRLDEGEDRQLRELLRWLSLDEAQYDSNLNRRRGRFTEESEALKTAVAKIDRVLA